MSSPSPRSMRMRSSGSAPAITFPADLGHLHQGSGKSPPYDRVFRLASQRAIACGLFPAPAPRPRHAHRIPCTEDSLRGPPMIKRALVLSAGLLSLMLLPHHAEAFWYARGWRGGVAVGGFRPPAVVTPYYL